MRSGGFVPEYDGSVPVRMRWQPNVGLEQRRCPRSWPHVSHGPWYACGPLDGSGVFDCPGVPFPAGRLEDA